MRKTWQQRVRREEREEDCQNPIQYTENMQKTHGLPFPRELWYLRKLKGSWASAPAFCSFQTVRIEQSRHLYTNVYLNFNSASALFFVKLSTGEGNLTPAQCQDPCHGWLVLPKLLPSYSRDPRCSFYLSFPRKGLCASGMITIVPRGVLEHQ